MLARVTPIQILPPLAFMAWARAQSSITSWRMAVRPPIRRSASLRRRMQPPAAPAVRAFGLAIQLGGSSFRKKKRKAGRLVGAGGVRGWPLVCGVGGQEVDAKG